MLRTQIGPYGTYDSTKINEIGPENAETYHSPLFLYSKTYRMKVALLLLLTPIKFQVAVNPNP